MKNIHRLLMILIKLWYKYKKKGELKNENRTFGYYLYPAFFIAIILVPIIIVGSIILIKRLIERKMFIILVKLPLMRKSIFHH